MSDSQPSGARVEIAEIRFATHASAQDLARAFGSVVFEPGWWPADVDALTYKLSLSEHQPQYQIGSIRPDGRPIVVLGQKTDPRARLPQESWYEPAELVGLGAIVAGTDIGYRAAVDREQQTVQLIGYSTEAEVVRAVLSLSRVTP